VSLDGAPAAAAEFLGQVWDGFVGRSLSSCVGAIAFALIEIACCCWFFAPPRLAELSPGVLMQDAGDEYCLLSFRLMHYRRVDFRGLQVAYLGASTATRSLLDHDPVALSRAVSRAAQRPVRFGLWSSNGQRYEDALVVLDQLPAHFQGAFVLVVNDYKDDDRQLGGAGQRFYERILAESASSRDELWREEGHAPHGTGVFFLDHLDFFAARRTAALRFGAAPRAPRRLEPPVDEAERLRRMREQLRAGWGRPPRRTGAPAADDRNEREPPVLGKNRRVIDKLVDKLTERGIIPVFVEAPLNPKRAPYSSRRLAQYYGDMARYAAERGVLYWNWNGALALSPEDFGDAIHLESPAARAEYQKLLTENLAEAMKRRFGARPGPSVKDEDEDG
jgi:hypothetical protein